MLSELLSSLRSHDLWVYMGWKDVQLKFRRSRIGPLWVILNTSFFIVFMGFLWSTIFKMDIKSYMLYFAIGHVVWVYFSSVINESISIFLEFEHVVKQIRLPFFVFPFRVVFRNTLIFLMNMSIVFLMLFLGDGLNFISILNFFAALLLLILSLTGASFFVSVAACRFKDLTQIIPNILLVVFFCTPIMWRKDALPPEKQWISDLNPISMILDSLRIPLMGGAISWMSWLGVLLLSVFVFFLGFLIFGKNIKKITQWL